jgi:hypothetical protein
VAEYSRKIHRPRRFSAAMLEKIAVAAYRQGQEVDRNCFGDSRLLRRIDIGKG